MLELLLKLIDRLIQLSKTRADNDRARMELIREMYHQLQSVHTDYMRMLESTSVDVQVGVDPAAIVRRLTMERLELSAVREHLKVATSLWRDVEAMHRFKEFIAAVGHYFDEMNSLRNPSASVKLIHAVEAAKVAGEGSQRLELIVSALKEELSSHMERVIYEYSKLAVHRT